MDKKVKVSPEELYLYYESLNRQQRREIDKEAKRLKKKNLRAAKSSKIREEIAEVSRARFKQLQEELFNQREVETGSKFTKE